MEAKKKSNKAWWWIGGGTLAAAGILGAMWYFSKPEAAKGTPPPSPEPTPVRTSTTSSGSGSSSRDGFPLKRGSRGSAVRALQQALVDRYGIEVLGGSRVDGDFGSKTEAALRSKGHPTTVSIDTFQTITNKRPPQPPSGNTTPTKINATDISEEIRGALIFRNIRNVLAQLKKMKTVEDYIAVNNDFKLTKIPGSAGILVTMTLVNGLFFYFTSAGHRDAIRRELLRMGLKEREGVWSLSGLDGPSTRTVKTVVTTTLRGNQGQRLMVPPQTVLGTEVQSRGGFSIVRMVDGSTISVASADLSSA